MAHMIMSTLWNGDLLCFHCGAREQTLPDGIDRVLKKVTSFQERHAECEPGQFGAALMSQHDAAAVESGREATP